MYHNCLMCCMTQESSIEQLCIPLSEEQIAIVSGCDWSGAMQALGGMVDKRKPFTNIE